MDENNPLLNVAMEIILYSGEARTLATKALSDAKSKNYEEANNNIKLAYEEIVKAHKSQTKVIQESVSGKSYEIDLLFIHAQDTLMTIKSELLTFEEMIKVYEILNELMERRNESK